MLPLIIQTLCVTWWSKILDLSAQLDYFKLGAIHCHSRVNVILLPNVRKRFFPPHFLPETWERLK